MVRERTGGAGRVEEAGAAPCRHTVVALFEDTIDAEHAMVALRKSDHPAEQVSLLVRDRDAEDGNGGNPTEVARALVATALDAVGSWLLGLAALIVPERGTFLAAGPLGAALAGSSAAHERAVALAEATNAAEATDVHTGALIHTLVDFGFSDDEAAYLENRLAAGSTLVAVTTEEDGQLQTTRRVFAAHDAVHIGMAETDQKIAVEAAALLAATPEVSSDGDVFVTDAVAPLHRLCDDEGTGAHAAALRAFCGAEVVDSAGHEAGTVDDVLAEANHDPAATAVFAARYLIVRYGGVLGIGRRHVAVPFADARREGDTVHLAVDKETLHRAPSFDPDAPFSRREEQATSAYFGRAPYWDAG